MSDIIRKRDWGNHAVHHRLYSLSRVVALIWQVVFVAIVLEQSAAAASVARPSFSLGGHAGFGGSRDHSPRVAPRIWAAGLDANFFIGHVILGAHYELVRQPVEEKCFLFCSQNEFVPTRVKTYMASGGIGTLIDRFYPAISVGVGAISGTRAGKFLYSDEVCEFLSCTGGRHYSTESFSTVNFQLRLQGILMMGKVADLKILAIQNLNTEFMFFEFGLGLGFGKTPKNTPDDAVQDLEVQP